jgi:predicted dehydrogenase
MREAWGLAGAAEAAEALAAEGLLAPGAAPGRYRLPAHLRGWLAADGARAWGSERRAALHAAAARWLQAAGRADEALATLDEALADRPVDLVAICTPTGLHVEMVEQALAAGRHVVVEKPLDVTLKRSRHLAEVAKDAEARGLIASVISQHRFDPASAVVARAIAEGRLGRLTSAVASVPWWRTQEYYDAAGWRGTWAFDGGAVMNQAVHTVDLLVWFMGTPVEVFAQNREGAAPFAAGDEVVVAWSPGQGVVLED